MGASFSVNLAKKTVNIGSSVKMTEALKAERYCCAYACIPNARVEHSAAQRIKDHHVAGWVGRHTFPSKVKAKHAVTTDMTTI